MNDRDDQPPTVSVVMGVYNGERYLDACIESMLAQEWRDFEFIIIDDGSTDGTGSILARYQAQDPRIGVYTQANRGHAASLNTGCALARGRYIARLDADDIALPDRLGRQVDFLEDNPAVALVGGAVWLIDSQGRCLGTGMLTVGAAQIREQLKQSCCIYHSTIMMRKAAFDAVGGYRVPFEDAEDMDLFLRMSERYALETLAEPVGLYRISSSQCGQQNLRRQALRHLAAQVAARLRCTTGADPFDQVAVITPELLCRHGVTENTINEHYVTAWINRAHHIQKAEGSTAAGKLLGEALAWAWETSQPRLLCARVHATYGAIYRYEGKTWRSLAHYAKAWRVLPGRAPGMLKRRYDAVIGRARLNGSVGSRSSS